MPTIGSIAGKLSSATRAKLPSKVFGMPGERKYPMPDPSHAANAKARATQQVKAGNLSESSKQQIDAKANKVLGKPRAKRETYASVKRQVQRGK